MAQNTTLKTASIVLDTPAELATVLGHRQSTAVVVETSKPAAAEALGVTLHKFNKWAEWQPVTHEIAATEPGTVFWRAINADEHDDSFSWWYLNDERIPVEVPWGEHAEDEDEPEEDDVHLYETLVDVDAPEGPQVILASRHVILGEPDPADTTPEGEALAAELDDELGDTVARLELAIENGEDLDTVRSKDVRPLAQYTDDGTRDFEDELAELDMGMDADDVAAVVEHIEEVRERLDASPDIPGLDDDALPTPNTDGVIVLDAKQSAELRRREAAAAELTAMDDRALAVKLMARLNSQDPDDARKVIDMGGVQSQMWMAAAQVAREHFNA